VVVQIPFKKSIKIAFYLHNIKLIYLYYLVGIVPIERTFETIDNEPPVWKIVKVIKQKSIKKNKYQNEVSLFFFIIWIKN